MKLNLKAIARMIANIFTFTGITMVLPVAVSIIYGEWDCTRAFLFVSVPLVLLGIFGRRKTDHFPKKISLRDGFLLMAVIWIATSLIAALPYVLQGCIPNYIDAFFESTSAFTTTGASVLKTPNIIPVSMLFWRSFSAWSGGIIFLLTALAFMPELGISGQNLVSAGGRGTMFSRPIARLGDFGEFICVLYLAMTAAETVLLYVGGMSLHEAALNAMDTVSTGGFDLYGGSVFCYDGNVSDSLYIEIVIMLFMVLSGASYLMYFMAIANKSIKVIAKNAEFKFYIMIMAASTLLITINLTLSSYSGSFGHSLKEAAFHVISIVTTSGFTLTNYDIWPTFSLMVLLILFFVGASSASPGSGMRCIRVLAIFKITKNSISSKMHPNAMNPPRISGKALEERAVKDIASFTFLYAALVFIIGLFAAFDGVDAVSGITASASCIGNIGSAFGSIGAESYYGFFSPFVKVVLSVAMIAGRLELYTVLLLFSRRFWNLDRN